MCQHNTLVEEYTVGDCRVEIHQDEDAVNPRTEYDHLGTLFAWHPRYNLCDRGARAVLIKAIENSRYYRQSWDEQYSWREPEGLMEMLGKCKDIYALDVYLYDHSGITINTTGFSCQWDSGIVGCIFITREDVLKEYRVKRVTKEVLNRVYKLLNAEVEELDAYRRGDVYGFIVTHKDGTEDSCWGFIGIDHVKESANEAARYLNDCAAERTQAALVYEI